MQRTLIVDPEKCTGCRICEVFCSLYKTDTCNPARSRVGVIRWEEVGIMIPTLCQHCQQPLCALVCPVNAISKDRETGRISVDTDRCVSCLMCVVICPLGAASLQPRHPKVILCDLCQGREEGSLCAQVCPTGAIKFVTADSASLAEKREAVEKLPSLMKRGLETLTGEGG